MIAGPDKLKQLPALLSDQAAEMFSDEADLSDYDLSGFRPVQFELRAKDQAVHVRLPKALLSAVKAEATRQNMPYSRFIRLTLEHALAPRG